MNIRQCITEYLERTKLYRSNGTYQYYLKTSKSILKALDYLKLESTSQLKKNTQMDLVRYFKTQTIKKNSQINADISFFYTVINFTAEHQMAKFEKLPDDTTGFRAINDKVLKKLVNYLKKLDINDSNYLSWTLATYLMLETGVRINEVLNIKSKNVDLISNSIILDATKNGKKRVVFFDRLSINLVKVALSHNKEYLIWNHNKDTQMNRHTIYYFFNQVNKDCNFNPRIHPHRLRKTFATNLLKAGCPLTTIQKLLGHSDIKMTMKYLEIDSAMIEKDYFDFYPYKKTYKSSRG